MWGNLIVIFGGKYNIYIVEAIVEIPVTDWPQAPFLVWLFFRTILNFLVERNKNFRPPSWFLAAILDLRARK